MSSTRKEQIFDWMRLAYTTGVGPIRFWKLLEDFGSAKKALSYLENTPTAFGRVEVKFPKDQAIEHNISTMEKFGANVVLGCDPDYPECLKVARDRPPLLFYKGDLSLLQQRIIAIVGSRNASLNGRKLAFKFAKELSSEGFVICSGLARGIDTEAHKGAKGGKTIAVLAGGLNIYYPEENKELQDTLFKQDLVITEAPFNMGPVNRHFPKRNRIVACLAEATLVIEASLKSGSLITATHALEYGRDVMAVPGSPMDPHCDGTNQLLKTGAALIRHKEDILETINSFQNLSFPKVVKTAPSPDATNFFSTKEENNLKSQENLVKTASSLDHEILSLLGNGPIHVDEIIRECQLSPATVLAKLQELELEEQISVKTGNMIHLT